MAGMASTLAFLLVRNVLRLIGLGPKQMTRTSRSPSCATSWQCCTARLPTPATHPPIAWSWPRWPDCCHASAGRRSWSRRRRCCVGIGRPYGVDGPTLVSPASGGASTLPLWSGVAAGTREPSLGLPPDLRGMHQARDEGVGHLGAQHPAPQWPGAGPEEGRSILGRVPSLPGRRCAGVRLLHSRDGCTHPDIRTVLH
jgi:hypothetical protein